MNTLDDRKKGFEAKYQHEANAIFDAEMPSATRCGSARPV